tara:strand:- start:557 stop:1255 length:699 start_codon:yes stop_codon:yes gene_type:complete
LSRVLLKLSGEALGGSQGFGYDSKILHFLSQEINKLVSIGHSVGLVLGGGNLVRGSGFAELGDDRVVGDQMGMLATIMNALAFSSFLNRNQIVNKVFSARGIAGVAQDYDKNDALEVLSSGRVGIFAGGTGNPFFTTDTAACLRAIELQCDIVVKATNVDGVYSSDPKTDRFAKKYDSITFNEVIEKDLSVMDMTAVLLCRDHKMPIIVCNIDTEDNLLKAVNGDPVGTKVS